MNEEFVGLLKQLIEEVQGLRRQVERIYDMLYEFTHPEEAVDLSSLFEESLKETAKAPKPPSSKVIPFRAVTPNRTGDEPDDQP